METHKIKILIVDDIEINRIILEEILPDEYIVEHASDGFEAISKMINTAEKPSLVLLDIMMPGMDGFEVLAFMKNNPTLKKIPVIFITASEQESKGLKEGASDYISKPFDPEIVRLRVAHHIELFLYRENLESLVEKKAEELTKTKENFLETMADLIEHRSLESGHHVRRTRDLAHVLTTQLIKKDRHYNELLKMNPGSLIKAVPLHDIGKIGIPDNILLKPGKLTPEEFKVIETHTVIGGQVIKSLANSSDDDYLLHAYNICRHHHERWNGSGYPDKLAGEEIPLSARIVAVVDVYDALVSERCYKKPMTHEEAMNIITSASETQFDPAVVETLVETQDLFRSFYI